MKRLRRFVSLCAVGITFLGVTIADSAQSKSGAAFGHLASLVGEWTGYQNGQEINLSYFLTADGSTLVEQFRPAKGPTMMTMFSVDGDRLVATHYCSAGNQPQMATAQITGQENNAFTFSLVRITGMRSPEDWHNTRLEIQLEDNDHLTQRLSYLYKGKAGTTIFHFAKKEP